MQLDTLLGASHWSSEQLNAVNDFYRRHFTFTQDWKFENVQEKLSQNLGKIESFVAGSSELTLEKCSFADLRGIVSEVLNSETFTAVQVRDILA